MISLGEGAQARSGDPWLQMPRHGAIGRYRLFCFHHAGGGASLYRNWARLLGPGVDVVPVQLPGRENRIAETAPVDFGTVVEAAAERIHRASDRPVFLFGHSLGAVLAFEVARTIESWTSAARPHAVIASGHRPPGAGANEGQRPRRSALSDEELLALVRTYNGTPGEVLEIPELRDLYLSLLRSDFRLIESFRPVEGGRLECPLLVIGGLSDPLVRRDDLQRWRDLTTGDFQVETFPGDHFFVRSQEVEICRRLADYIQRTADSRSARR